MNDDFEDFRRYEEYQRQKDAQFAKGVGNFLFYYIGYAFVWLFTSAFTATVLENMFGVGIGTSLLVGVISGFLIFKVPYVKANPFKSFIVICFIFGLSIVAFQKNS